MTHSADLLENHYLVPPVSENHGSSHAQRWQHRLELHFLPKYSPQTNPIERVWWHVHETVTRNHRYPTIDALLDDALGWLAQKRRFAIETSLYQTQAA